MKRIFIKTYGCQSNVADSEQMAGILKEKRYKIVNNIKNADIVIINTCSVKTLTQNKILSFIKQIPKSKKIYVGGCLPKIINLKKYSNNIAAIFDVNSILKLPEIIKNPRNIMSKEKEKRINLPKIRKNKEIAIINIANGCLGNCDYCAAKLARGKLKSYKIENIKQEFKTALKEGCKKFYITSQDNGCYGFDIGTNIVELLKELVKIKGNFIIRVGMMNPNYVLNFLDELIEIYKHPKIMKFVHLPVQSGSNSLLKKIGRNYTIADFKKIVKKFRKEILGITIGTDIIVGHPLETEQDFKETIKLLKETKPEILNISKFSSIKKTKASKLKQLKTEIIKERSVKISKLFK